MVMNPGLGWSSSGCCWGKAAQVAGVHPVQLLFREQGTPRVWYTYGVRCCSPAPKKKSPANALHVKAEGEEGQVGSEWGAPHFNHLDRW